MPQVPSTSEQSGEQQQENSLKQFHAVLMFLIVALGGYLQSRSISPFEDHKYTMIAISVALSMYAFGLMAEYKTQNPIYHSILKRFNPLIGILVVVLLMIMLFPLLGLVGFILWALFMLEALVKTFQQFLRWLPHLKQIIRSYFDRPRREENGSATPASQRNEILPV